MTIFGKIYKLDFENFAYISMGGFVFLLCLEKLVNFLSKWASNHGYNLLFQKTANELMVLGIISFIVAIITAESSAPSTTSTPSTLASGSTHSMSAESSPNGDSTLSTSSSHESTFQESPLYFSFEFYHLTILFIGFAFVLQAILLAQFVNKLSDRFNVFRRTASEALIEKFNELASGTRHTL